MNKDLISKHPLIVFALFFIHSFWVDRDYLGNPTK